jgi:hypothetical protein
MIWLLHVRLFELPFDLAPSKLIVYLKTLRLTMIILIFISSFNITLQSFMTMTNANISTIYRCLVTVHGTFLYFD